MRAMLSENTRLSPSARTLWEIQALCERLPLEAKSNIYDDVKKRAARALAKGGKLRARVNDGASLRAYQANARSRFLDCIGGIPVPPSHLPARVIHTREYPRFVLEKVILEPLAGARATANVYAPKQLLERAPAVLITVGHSDIGKADPEYQYLAQLLAHAGFIALVLDPLGEGERFEHYEPEIDFQPIQGCSGEHDLLDWKCKLLGMSLARYFIRDGMAALEYLAARDDVDAQRIALTGHSGGGTQVCMLALAASDMLAAAAPCAYMTDARAMLEYGVDPDNEMLWRGSISAGLDYVDMIAGMAPKPVIFLTNAHDFFPIEGARRTYEQACALWRAAGAEHLPEYALARSGHAYARSLAHEATQFFSKHLLGRDARLDDFSYSPLTKKELDCTPEGSILMEYPDARTVHHFILDELNERRARRKDIVNEVKWLAREVGYNAKAETPAPRVLAEGVCAPYTYRVISWKPEQGYVNAGVLIRDMRAGDAPLNTLIALWREGLKRIEEHSNFLHRAVRAGWQVLIMDVPASGALAPAPIANSNMHIGWGTLYKLNAYLIQLNDSLLGLRVRCAARARRMLDELGCVKRVTYFGAGEYARYALLAALITGARVYADEEYQQYTDIVNEKYHDQMHTPDWAFPDVLEHFDMKDIVEYLDKRGALARDRAEIFKEDA